VKATALLFEFFRKAVARENTVGALQVALVTETPSREFGEHDSIAGQRILKRIILITERFPREYDHMYRALLDMLRTFEKENNLSGFLRIWSVLAHDVLSTPQWLDLLFPGQTGVDPGLIARAQAANNRRHLQTEAALTEAESPSSRNEVDSSDGLFEQLLEALATNDPGGGPPFLFLSRFYFFRDILYGYFVDVGLKPIQRAIFHQCYLQRRNWRQSYAADYPYQGMERLAISGVKPTEERFARYDITEYLGATDRVLDIGSNNGFWALALATRVGHVDGLEFNPYLVAIANIAKDFLGAVNASFIPGDFVDFETSEKYDVVCSLANHCTIDGNLSMDFEQYIAKVFSLLKPGGILFFESHNVFGPGAGGAGDDGDLDAKFDIVERYFSVLRYKMTQAYVPAFDIGKLFVVLRRRDRYEADVVRTLRLSDARQRYGY
jgi:SAM-dependent methyltransferase